MMNVIAFILRVNYQCPSNLGSLSAICGGSTYMYVCKQIYSNWIIGLSNWSQAFLDVSDDGCNCFYTAG